MFQREISIDEVNYVLQNGIILMEYANDKPYSSKLLMSFCNERPIHVVCSDNEKDEVTVIITVYQPTLDIWENNFKTRKK